MSSALLRELSCLERSLASSRLSPEQRRRLRPLIALICLRIVQSIGRPAG